MTFLKDQPRKRKTKEVGRGMDQIRFLVAVSTGKMADGLALQSTGHYRQ